MPPGKTEAPQVTGRLTPTERQAFANYADELGLDAGTIATLLMSRELRTKRLVQLSKKPQFRAIENCSRTVTTHRFQAVDKQRFVNHAKEIGLSASKALGILCRAELAERWLDKALNR